MDRLFLLHGGGRHTRVIRHCRRALFFARGLCRYPCSHRSVDLRGFLGPRAVGVQESSTMMGHPKSTTLRNQVIHPCPGRPDTECRDATLVDHSHCRAALQIEHFYAQYLEQTTYSAEAFKVDAPSPGIQLVASTSWRRLPAQLS